MVMEQTVQPEETPVSSGEDLEEGIRRIIEAMLLLEESTPQDLDRIKIRISKVLHLRRIPSNADIIARLTAEEKEKLIPVLRRKPVRTISGIAVIAVMTKPTSCPHGRCAYCPGGPEQGVPQSYTGREPAAMRGAQNDYDAYRQVRARLRQLQEIGHDVEKSEIIIMGGTFPATLPTYQRSFLKGCLDGLIGRRTRNITEAIRLAESSRVRNVGMTVETRPECMDEAKIDDLLSMGITRVEIGVQNVYDDIYELVHRSHRVKDVVTATELLKDSGLKVCYHMMPGLPGSNPQRDLEGFKATFRDERFKPDMLKIYPCLVLKDTELYDWWHEGKYKPYSDDEAAELIAQVKAITPPWIRIMRVQRDIPSNLIAAGVKHSNLRELAKRRLDEDGVECRCIRCREIGHKKAFTESLPAPENLRLRRIEEAASGGIEVFLSYENEDFMAGFLRLRIPSDEAHRPEIRGCSASLVRELRVLGQAVPLGRRYPKQWQHRGLGSRLLNEAEKIAREEFNRKKVVVTSAIGTRNYYRRRGYKQEGPYVSKRL